MKTITHTRNFEMPQPIARLFPLFSPEGEKHWVPGWDYHTPMDTTELCEDYVFFTRTHDHGATEAIWIVKEHDPAAYRVSFYKIEPGEKIGVITVQCSELAPVRTAVQVSYKYLALSATGEEFLASFSEDAYAAFIAEWQRLLTDYFASGAP